MNGEFQTTVTLEADIRAVVGLPGARPPVLPAVLEARRVALLAGLLGFQPGGLPPPLHVVGDSHVGFFAGAEKLEFHRGRRLWTGFFRPRYVNAFTELLPVFRVFHLGPATAWNAAEYGASTRAREKLDALVKHRDLPPGALLLLVFGEIDVRCHLPKAVLAGKPVAAAAAEAVARFVRLPLRLRELGFDPAVWLPSVTPVAAPTADTGDDRLIPFIGPQELRDEIRDAYCATLAAACDARNIRRVRLVPPPQLAHSQCFIDANHLSQRLMPAALAALIKAGILPLSPRGLRTEPP